MAQTTSRETSSPNVIPVVAWGALVVAALALGMYAQAPHAPPGAGPTLPRVPGPPQSLPILLYMLGVGSIVWYAVTIAFPFLLWAARRIESTRPTIERIVALAAVTLIAGVAVTCVVDYLVTYPAIYRPPFAAFISEGIRRSVLPWASLIAVVAGIEVRRHSVRSSVERERLRAQIAEQRLVALTGQLQPHFLFNTLQGISTLIHRDPNAADEMLAKLSDLLRDLLRHREQALVSLGDELKYTRTYLEIAQIRFADRLKFTIDVPDELRTAGVPLFILQPLVENAIGHGIGGQALGGTITVRGRRAGDRLRLEVEDDGVGLNGNLVPEESVGLTNTRERLRACFGSDASLFLEGADGGGAVARIDAPFRPFVSVGQS